MSEPNDWHEAQDMLAEARPPKWPTYRREQSRKAAQAERAALIAAYRLNHPETPATMTDATVWALLMIDAIGRRSA